jgi:putative hydrolase of the HAD superfamily
VASGTKIKTLFLDIGGVLLTNGWDHHSRQQAAEFFNLDYEDMNERHHLTFDTYESGKLSLGEYLDRVVFFRKRSFTPEQFREFMFSQSRPYPEMIDLVKDLKSRFGLKIAAVSNEGRELTTHRINTFHLREFIDFFISSCFVHFRKPDEDIFRIALDISQTAPENVLYIEDRRMFVDVARTLGIRSVHHTAFESTRQGLQAMGLSTETSLS